MHKIARQKPACANVGPDPTRPADGPDPCPTQSYLASSDTIKFHSLNRLQSFNVFKL